MVVEELEALKAQRDDVQQPVGVRLLAAARAARVEAREGVEQRHAEPLLHLPVVAAAALCRRAARMREEQLPQALLYWLGVRAAAGRAS